MKDIYNVVHHGSTIEIDACIVAPLQLPNHGAVLSLICTIVKVKAIFPILDVAHSNCPVPGPLSPFNVRGISSISAQACCDIEEAAIRDGVFIIVSAIEGKDLPP